MYARAREPPPSDHRRRRARAPLRPFSSPSPLDARPFADAPGAAPRQARAPRHRRHRLGARDRGAQPRAERAERAGARLVRGAGGALELGDDARLGPRARAAALGDEAQALDPALSPRAGTRSRARAAGCSAPASRRAAPRRGCSGRAAPRATRARRRAARASAAAARPRSRGGARRAARPRPTRRRGLPRVERRERRLGARRQRRDAPHRRRAHRGRGRARAAGRAARGARRPRGRAAAARGGRAAGRDRVRLGRPVRLRVPRQDVGLLRRDRRLQRVPHDLLPPSASRASTRRRAARGVRASAAARAAPAATRPFSHAHPPLPVFLSRLPTHTHPTSFPAPARASHLPRARDARAAGARASHDVGGFRVAAVSALLYLIMVYPNTIGTTRLYFKYDLWHTSFFHDSKFFGLPDEVRRRACSIYILLARARARALSASGMKLSSPLRRPRLRRPRLPAAATRRRRRAGCATRRR